jgi:hypothetical protein
VWFGPNTNSLRVKDSPTILNVWNSETHVISETPISNISLPTSGSHCRLHYFTALEIRIKERKLNALNCNTYTVKIKAVSTQAGRWCSPVVHNKVYKAGQKFINMWTRILTIYNYISNSQVPYILAQEFSLQVITLGLCEVQLNGVNPHLWADGTCGSSTHMHHIENKFNNT